MPRLGRMTSAGPVTIRKPDGTVEVQPPLNVKGGTRELIPGWLARQVYARDGHRCRYCGREDGPWQLDHVRPVSKGGKTTLSNLVVACRWCNQRKHDRIWKPVPLRLHRARLSRPPSAKPKVRNLPPQEYQQLRAMQAKRAELGMR
jgi:hypothetical protein